MKIAVIGSGIAGLSSAYLLHRDHDIHVFEADDRIGGHTCTDHFDIAGQSYHADTGFIVFNARNYPCFSKLLLEIGAEIEQTSMSVSVSNPVLGLEYNGGNLDMLYVQRQNLLRREFHRMVYEILRFNQAAKRVHRTSPPLTCTLGEYLSLHDYSDWFVRNYLEPMGMAVWSANGQQILDTPLVFFARFFDNHGMLSLFDRPDWYVIKGGSSRYLPLLTQGFADRIHTQHRVSWLERREAAVRISFEHGTSEEFDRVIVATHPDQALRFLASPSEAEKQVLSAFSYSPTEIVIHTDESLMPKNRRAWASWNIRLNADANRSATLTYSMNHLFSMAGQQPLFVTLNGEDSVAPEKVLKTVTHAHPIYTSGTLDAQSRHSIINGADRVYYCGAYWGNGFHEDAVVSAQSVAHLLTDPKGSHS